MKNKLLIFDFDGTLVDSLPLWQKVDYIFFDERRNIKYSINDIDFRPMSVEEAAIAAKTHYNLEDSIESIKKEWIDICNELYFTQDILRKEAIPLLKKAKEKNYKIAIGTNNTVKLVTSLLEKEGIDAYFDYILSADHVKNSKPAPDIFLLIANHFNILPKDTIVIEDSLAGTLAAHNANMYVYTLEENESLEHKDEILKYTNKYIYSLNDVIL